MLQGQITPSVISFVTLFNVCLFVRGVRVFGGDAIVFGNTPRTFTDRARMDGLRAEQSGMSNSEYWKWHFVPNHRSKKRVRVNEESNPRVNASPGLQHNQEPVQNPRDLFFLFLSQDNAWGADSNCGSGVSIITQLRLPPPKSPFSHSPRP